MSHGRGRVIGALIAGVLAASALVAQAASATAGPDAGDTTAPVRACRTVAALDPCGSPPTTSSYPLGVEVVGQGTVTSDPGGITCREGGIRRSARADNVCSDAYAEGTVVTLTATPDPGHEFDGWGGDCSGATLTCQVTVDDVRSVLATFRETPTYAVLTGVVGEGTVWSDPGSIECRDELPEPSRVARGADPCYDEFAEGATVTLTAEPDPGWAFTGWTTWSRTRLAHRVPPQPGCTGTSPVCELTVYADVRVQASFERVPESTLHRLSVSTAGDGAGVVTSAPAGIACHGNTEGDRICSKRFESGTTVTLTATPEAGSTFTGFGGACSGTSCTVTMSGARSVTARFERVTGTLRVTTSGDGTGAVTSSPAGLSCGTTCTGAFPEGSEVTLTAVPDAGSGFGGFTGCATTDGTTCTVVVGAGTTTVGARFTDTAAPQTRVTRTPGNPLNDHSIFRFVSSEAGSTFECSIDGGPRQACTPPTDYRCLAAGRHVFRVWATDPAGNTDATAAVHRFRVRSGPGC
jgi:hypothetical protein